MLAKENVLGQRHNTIANEYILFSMVYRDRPSLLKCPAKLSVYTLITTLTLHRSSNERKNKHNESYILLSDI